MEPITYGFWRSISLFKTHRNFHSAAFGHLTEAHSRVLTLGISDIKSEFHEVFYESNASEEVRHLFDKMSEWDIVSASSVIGQLARNNCHEEAIFLFSKMLGSDVRPNEFTFGTAIHSSISLKGASTGKQLHACSIKMGLGSNVFVGSSALDFYSKMGEIEDAKQAFEDTHMPNVVSYTTLIFGYLKKGKFEEALRLFQEMPERNVVSWNAMIGGYSQTGHNEGAVNLFVEMLRQGFLPNHSTFPCVISASANIAMLGMGKSFHASAVKFLGNLGEFVENALVSFYAKCGSMEDSLFVFNRLPERNIVSWNAIIFGYAQNGRAKEAINVYENMQDVGFQPNSVTLLGVLLACNHAGFVNEGYSYFNKARLEYPRIVKSEHYACVIDLLSRSGHFKEAQKFLYDLPFDPGIGFWKALLGGCQIHSNIELGEFAARKILNLDPKDVSSYVMLSNAHSAAGRWEAVSSIRREMHEKQMKRIPGCSWIEIRSKVHNFLTGDKNHDKMDDICMVLRIFAEHIKVIHGHDFLIGAYE